MHGNSLPGVLVPQVSPLLPASHALRRGHGAGVGCQGSGRQRPPAQPPLFPVACGSALHHAAVSPHREPATLLKTFCLLEEWMPFFLHKIDSQPEQADVSAVPLGMHASGQHGRAETGVVLSAAMAMFC